MHKDIRKIVKEGYEDGDYEGHFRKNSQPNEMELNFLKRLTTMIPQAAKILDFGCGIGLPFDKYLTDKGFQVTGVDVSRKHIQKSRKNVPDATFIEGDFSMMDFGDERFHAIVAFYSIFHIPKEEQRGLFYKMYELLEDEGAVLMTLGASEHDGVEEDWTGAPMAWSSFSPDTYKTMLQQTGFRITESEYQGKPGDEEYHWWVLAIK